MKIFYIIGISTLILTTMFFSSMSRNKKTPTQTIYGIPLVSLSGEAINLAEFKGKKILFVNVASHCGFTPQYEELQKLHDKYQNKLVIIGLPCNQFGSQEPGSAEEIQTFCKRNYGVSFLISEKLDVKGDNQHSLYKWLTSKELNGKVSTTVKWNFQKYLIDEEGNFVDYWLSTTSPTSSKIIKAIEN